MPRKALAHHLSIYMAEPSANGILRSHFTGKKIEAQKAQITCSRHLGKNGHTHNTHPTCSRNSPLPNQGWSLAPFTPTDVRQPDQPSWREQRPAAEGRCQGGAGYTSLPLHWPPSNCPHRRDPRGNSAGCCQGVGALSSAPGTFC